MVARCEYCDFILADINEARRHMLSVGHIRMKRSYELSQVKQIERLRESSIVPKNLDELMKLLNIQTDQDIANLEKAAFFKISTQGTANISRQLIKIIQNNIVDYRLAALPTGLRRPLFEAIERHQATNRDQS